MPRNRSPSISLKLKKQCQKSIQALFPGVFVAKRPLGRNLRWRDPDQNVRRAPISICLGLLKKLVELVTTPKLD